MVRIFVYSVSIYRDFGLFLFQRYQYQPKRFMLIIFQSRQ